MKKTIGLFFLFSFFAVTPLIHAETFVPHNVSSVSQSRLRTSFVCMVNDKFIGAEQIPVEVNGKTYYGCCEGCKKTLNSNPNSRRSIDPYTGKEVDKTEAFIVIKPGTTNEVLYFESEGSFQKYADLISKE